MIDDIKAIFSKNLNVLMNRMGANVSDVSEKTGIPYSTVNDRKNGKKMPRGGNLQKLADYFHVNLSDLTSESSPTNIIPVTPDNLDLHYVSERLGHKSQITTASIYAHVLKETKERGDERAAEITATLYADAK